MNNALGIKETYAICMAVAGLVRAVARMASWHNELAGELAHLEIRDPSPEGWVGTLAERIPLLPIDQLDELSELLVLATEVASLGAKLEASSGVVQRMRRKLDSQKESIVSRETLPSGRGVGSDEPPDTDPMGPG